MALLVLVPLMLLSASLEIKSPWGLLLPDLWVMEDGDGSRQEGAQWSLLLLHGQDTHKSVLSSQLTKVNMNQWEDGSHTGETACSNINTVLQMNHTAT